MNLSTFIEEKKQEWADMEPKFKWAIGVIIVGGAVLVYVRGKEHDELVAQAEAAKVAKAQVQLATAQTDGTVNNGMTMSAIPKTHRNQGLEDLKTELEKTSADAKKSKEKADEAATLVQTMNDRILALEAKRPAAGQSAAASLARGGDQVNLNDALPPPVDFNLNAPGKKGADRAAPNNVDFSLGSSSDGKAGSGDRPAARSAMKVWDAEAAPVVATKKGTLEKSPTTIPVNSALESVMLTGINARSNAAGGAPAGSVMSANSVGAPFVTRIKGSAILPNGWRVSDLGDCFMSGNGIAVLSSERANVIGNRISCIDKNGVILEAAVEAYGVDLDGIQGISGRVVTKQGAILAKTALAGVASGLGAALTPTSVPGYNANQQSGNTQGIQYPNPTLIAQSSLGAGVSSASTQLSKFYLDYAKEMFPVIEVNAGTRITWIFLKTVELNPNL